MIFRAARHTNKLESLIAFYTQVLEFEVLGEFRDHDGYDGVFLGRKNEKWHLEFTTTVEAVNHQFDEDDLLVFYPENEEEYTRITDKIKTSDLLQLEPKNPYWKTNGILITDPDGYGIIISDLELKK